jgi:hypothetical protein
VRILLTTRRMTQIRSWASVRNCLAAIPLLLLLSACGTDERGSEGERASGQSARELCLLGLGDCGTASRSSAGSDTGSDSGTDTGSDTGEVPSGGSTDTTDLRRDGIIQGSGGSARTWTNPFGLRRRMWASAADNRAFLSNTWSRAVAVQEATGQPIRIVFHQPGGWFAAFDDGMRGAIPTVQVMTGRKKNGSKLYPWRWAVWSEELSAMAAAHPDWILGVYFSGQVPTAAAQDAVDASQAWEIYDHEKERHRNLMLRVVDQWMAVGVREFLLDGSAKTLYAEDMPKLAAAIRARGGRMFVEGHPRDDANDLRLDLLQQVDGSVATHKFMVNNEPKSFDWVVPDGSVMMVTLQDHEFPEAPDRSSPTWNDVLGYRARGFTLLSGDTVFDHFVSE